MPNGASVQQLFGFNSTIRLEDKNYQIIEKEASKQPMQAKCITSTNERHILSIEEIYCDRKTKQEKENLN
jgi:hypothetical protein